MGKEGVCKGFAEAGRSLSVDGSGTMSDENEGVRSTGRTISVISKKR